PGRCADLFVTADHTRLDPRLGIGDAISALAHLAEESRERQLLPMLDLVVDQVAAESALCSNGSGWYRIDTDDEPPDPRLAPSQSGVAKLQIRTDPDDFVKWWAQRLIEWVDAGVKGFRCIRPHHVPAALWREVIATVRRRHADACFIASTLEVRRKETMGLAACGFDLVICCSRGWDFRVEGFGETVDCLTQIAPLIGMPEAPFERRLGGAFTDSGRARRAAERAFAFTTSFGAGWLIAMGFEFGAARRMDSARDRPEDFERLVAEAPFNLATEIAAANARAAAPSETEAFGPLRILSPPDA